MKKNVDLLRMSNLSPESCPRAMLMLTVVIAIFASSLGPCSADDSSGTKSQPSPSPVKIPVSGAQERSASEDSPTADPLAQEKIIIKHGEEFIVFDRSGQIKRSPRSPFGVYRSDTRYFDHWCFTANGIFPELLSTTSNGYSAAFVYGLKSSDKTPDRDISIQREIALLDGASERITITNFSSQSVILNLKVECGCDFRDMMEIRGFSRKHHGRLSPPAMREAVRRWEFKYEGLDKTTRLATFAVTPHEQADSTLVSPRSKSEEQSGSSKKVNAWECPEQSYVVHAWKLELPPHSEKRIELEAGMSEGSSPFDAAKSQISVSFADRLKRAHSAYAEWLKTCAAIWTNNETFNAILDRSYRDLYILQQKTPKGPCLAAGLPWYACAFGRDQAITGLQTLTFMPDLANNVIRVLAAYQGKIVDAAREEAPGKIMHELRVGEMARTREIPFRPYYGTVDATPLWIMLVGKYVTATGDRALAENIWPNVEAALAYLKKSQSAEGFLHYGGGGALANQCWKDSGNSIMHRDGKLAQPPISVCEVQGYLFDAYMRAADLCALLGKADMTPEFEHRAESLKKQFRQHFWLDGNKYIALALDKSGKRCAVFSSNPGHLLLTQILEESEADIISKQLTDPSLFCGWGIRTLSKDEKAYNPMSYHNGSVWPHDNGMIVSGLCARGHKGEALKIVEGLYCAASTDSDLRLPELFCGFDRGDSKAPVAYPVSCSPQAWAAGCLFQVLDACLGLKPRGLEHTLEIDKPKLPRFLNELTITGLRVGSDSCDLRFTRISAPAAAHENYIVGCEILKKTPALKVVIHGE
ncbi:MAG TPA: glycogen debranching N-terminal domain-containing protein [Candidatus Obscuribacterales bacterium]